MEEDEQMDARRRALQDQNSGSQDAVFKFCRFQTVERFTTPHPFEAMRLLERLATDPAIKRLMKQVSWGPTLLFLYGI
jgi:hypothetical protein